MNTIKNPKEILSGRYILIIFVAVVFTWLLHEWAHWLTGTLLGNKMGMTLNTSYPVAGNYRTASDENSISIAGPLVTLLEAVVIFLIMKFRNARQWYPFLLVCFYMRLLAAVLSFINANDEARVSSNIGLGKMTLPFFMVVLLFSLVYFTAGRYHFSKKFTAKTIGFILLFSSLLILSDQFLHLQIL